jgi:hypothetical protein
MRSRWLGLADARGSRLLAEIELLLERRATPND